MLKRLGLVLAVAGLVACGSTSRAGAAVHLHRILTGLDQPTYLTAAPGDSRLFVLQKTGKILVDRNGKLLARPFLNLQAKVSTTSEQGLLSMAFDPHYGKNGWFYVSYINVNGDSRIVRYRVEPHHPNIASPHLGQDPAEASPAVRQSQRRPDRVRPRRACCTPVSATAAARVIPTVSASVAPAFCRRSCA